MQETVTRRTDIVAIGQRLKQARKEKKISQVKLAELSKISMSSVSRTELGTQSLTFGNMGLLADALGVSMDWLYRGIEGPENE